MLIIVGLAVGPGGYSIFKWRRFPDEGSADGGAPRPRHGRIGRVRPPVQRPRRRVERSAAWWRPLAPAAIDVGPEATRRATRLPLVSTAPRCFCTWRGPTRTGARSTTTRRPCSS